MLVHSVDTQDAATLARTESVEACADHVDWIETHALNAIRGIRAMNAKADEADAALFAAWDRRLAAFNTLQELPDNPQGDGENPEIGRASWRERVCQYG